jgi:hypothetical protein
MLNGVEGLAMPSDDTAWCIRGNVHADHISFRSNADIIERESQLCKECRDDAGDEGVVHESAADLIAQSS